MIATHKNYEKRRDKYYRNKRPGEPRPQGVIAAPCVNTPLRKEEAIIKAQST